MKEHRAIEGWNLLGVASALLVGMTAAVLAAYGVEEAGVRVLIRATARSSLLLFALAFTASALVHFWPGWWTKWLRRNRRQVGLSFAVSHSIHYAAVFAVSQLDPEQFFVEEGRLLLGASTMYTTALLAVMIATSFDAPTRILGPKRWRALHLFGTWSFWLFFSLSYGGRAVDEMFYRPFAAILLAALALRVAAFWSKRRSAVA